MRADPRRQLCRNYPAAENRQGGRGLTKADQRLAESPRPPAALSARGGPGRLRQAQRRHRHLTKLTEEYPGCPSPYNNLAVLYASQNQLDKSRAALEMAIRTNPSYATAHETWATSMPSWPARPTARRCSSTAATPIPCAPNWPDPQPVHGRAPRLSPPCGCNAPRPRTGSRRRSNQGNNPGRGACIQRHARPPRRPPRQKLLRLRRAPTPNRPQSILRCGM